MEKDSFGFGGIKFKVVGSRPLVYGVDAVGETVGGMSGVVGAVEVECKVIGVGMKGHFWVVGKDLERGDEVHFKNGGQRTEPWGTPWPIGPCVIERGEMNVS